MGRRAHVDGRDRKRPVEPHPPRCPLAAIDTGAGALIRPGVGRGSFYALARGVAGARCAARSPTAGRWQADVSPVWARSHPSDGSRALRRHRRMRDRCVPLRRRRQRECTPSLCTARRRAGTRRPPGSTSRDTPVVLRSTPGTCVPRSPSRSRCFDVFVPSGPRSSRTRGSSTFRGDCGPTMPVAGSPTGRKPRPVARRAGRSPRPGARH